VGLGAGRLASRLRLRRRPAYPRTASRASARVRARPRAPVRGALPEENKMVKVSLVSLALLLGCASALEPGKSLVPCDANDHAAQVDLAANAARCRFEIDKCETVACRDQVIAKCDAYVDERCKLPESK
jgi:hypothetical protein